MNIKHSEYLIQATVFSHSTCIPLSFLSEGLLVRDQRMVERKKPGQKKARKKFTWCVRYRCMFSVYFSLSSQGKAVINVLLDSTSSVKLLLLYECTMIIIGGASPTLINVLAGGPTQRLS